MHTTPLPSTMCPSHDGLLDPLDVEGLRPAFIDADTPRLSADDITPSSEMISLPTPGRPGHAPVADLDHLHLFSPLLEQGPMVSMGPDRWNTTPPPAPLLKDLDSFTEGTALGSFDFSLDSCPPSPHVTIPRPLLESVAFSPDHPSHSIEIWRDDVLRNAHDDDLSSDFATSLYDEHMGTSEAAAAASESLPPTTTHARKRSLSSAFEDADEGRQLTFFHHGHDGDGAPLSCPAVVPAPWLFTNGPARGHLHGDFASLDRSVSAPPK